MAAIGKEGLSSHESFRSRVGNKIVRTVVDHLPYEAKLAMGRIALEALGQPVNNDNSPVDLKKDIDELVPGEARLRLRQIAQTEPWRFPEVIAIIPDGNTRYEISHELPEGMGHELGAEVLYKSIGSFEEFQDLIKSVKFWAWSDDNEKKRKKQKPLVQGVILKYLQMYTDELNQKGCKIVHSGRDDRLIEGLKEQLEASQKLTENNTGLEIVLGIDYGAIDENVSFAKKVAEYVLPHVEVDKETGEKKFDVGLLEPNVVADLREASWTSKPANLTVRTSGEQRLSGYQLAIYSELVFEPKNLPDMTEDDFDRDLYAYTQRTITNGGLRPSDKNK